MSNLVSLKVEQPKLPELPAERRSEMLTVVDADTYEFGVAMVAEVKQIWKQIDDKRATLKAGALKACRDIDAFFKSPLDYYASEERAIKEKLMAFRTAADAAERRARVAAEQAAAKERAELATAALAAAASGDPDKAEALIAQSEVVTAAPLPDSALNIGGASTRHKWVLGVTDKAAFLAAVCADPALMDYVDINLSALTKLAQLKGRALAYPGISCVKEEILVIRPK